MSNIVRLHPRLLSLSEFFGSLGERVFVARRLTGELFWQLLAKSGKTAVRILGNVDPPDELLYPVRHGRFTWPGIPPIMKVTLPHLSEEYEKLLDELEEFICRQPPRPLVSHYSALFDWLCHRFGRDQVVERSGSSLKLVTLLAKHFPSARFVHLYRDGRDTAMSMREHQLFRLEQHMFSTLSRLGISPDRPPFLYGESRLYPILGHGLKYLPIRRRLTHPPAIEAFGAHWSRVIINGAAALHAVEPWRVLPLRFENLVTRPDDELVRLVEFIGEDYLDPDWLAEAGRLPRAAPSAWRRLPTDVRDRLNRACGPGLSLLGYQ